MRLLLWSASLICLTFWSLLAWGAAGLVGAAQSWVPALGGDPLGLGLTAANWADLLGLAGQGAILVGWAIGALMIVIGTALLSRTLQSVGRFLASRRSHGRSVYRYTPHRRSSSLLGNVAARLAPRLLRAVRR
jgi:hypothetical protein